MHSTFYTNADYIIQTLTFTITTSNSQAILESTKIKKKTIYLCYYFLLIRTFSLFM
jgi:hypothetical protein